MDNVIEYLNYLYKLETTGIKYDLKNINALMEEMGNPHKNLKCVHVAGTNGKGATASFIASILMEHNIKTGLFTSPHILKFNERIRIGGKTIPDSFIKKFLNEYKSLIERIKPSFFEVTTALCFKYFSDNKVEAAVIEAGLGGRLDSTNIISPKVAVITEIGIDHTEYLGSTIEQIAKEKMGIIKNGAATVIADGHKGLRKTFEKNTLKTSLTFTDDVFESQIMERNINKTVFRCKMKHYNGFQDGIEFEMPFCASYQVRNAAAAVISAIKFLKSFNHEYSVASMQKGIKNIKRNTGYRYRFEHIYSGGKNYILDVSHNPDGISVTIQTCKDLHSFEKFVVVFGMMKDKDYRSSIDKLARFAGRIIFTRPKYERAVSEKLLFSYAGNLMPHQKISQYANIKDALKEAGKKCGKNDVIVVTGSFFMVSDAVRELRL